MTQFLMLFDYTITDDRSSCQCHTYFVCADNDNNDDDVDNLVGFCCSVVMSWLFLLMNDSGIDVGVTE